MEENYTLVERILKELSSPKELNKRQISLFLKPELLEQLDNLLKEFNNYSQKVASRNYLIEIAVENLIQTFPKVLEEYNKKYREEVTETLEFDTVVYPSYSGGLETLIKEHKWYYVRINKENIEKIKYIALYLGYPDSCITHYAIVDKYKEEIIDGKRKYSVYIKGDIIPLDQPVVLGSTNPVGMRSPKYTTLAKLKSATEVVDLN